MQDNIVVLVALTLSFLLLIYTTKVIFVPTANQPSAWTSLLAYWEQSDIRKREQQALEAKLTAEASRQQVLLQRNVVVVSERSLERGLMDSVPLHSEEATVSLVKQA